MMENLQKRLPGRTALLVFVLLLVAVVAAQAEGDRHYPSAQAMPAQAEPGLLMRRIARVALELAAPGGR